MTFFSKSNVATIAIVTGIIVASGTGGAVAGAMITGKQIKDGTVTTADIKNNSLKGTDIKASSLTGTDVKDGSIGTTDLAPAARGITGVVVATGQKVVAANQFSNLTVVCPAGTKLLAANGWWSAHNDAVQADASVATQATFFATQVDSADFLRGRILCGVY